MQIPKAQKDTNNLTEFFMPLGSSSVKAAAHKHVEMKLTLGIDVEHVKVVLDELARYHSTSHAYIMNKAKQSSLDQVSLIFY
jgi:hypothetical protein